MLLRHRFAELIHGRILLLNYDEDSCKIILLFNMLLTLKCFFEAKAAVYKKLVVFNPHLLARIFLFCLLN